MGEVAYKFLDAGLRSYYDGSAWEVGVWRDVPAPTQECVGLNASRLIPDALGYVQGEVVARVEYEGTVIEGTDKLTCQRMRVVAWTELTKEHSVRLAIFAARQCLHIYETAYPDDKRPRLAIEAAEAWLADPSDAASDARAAAGDASDAAYAAARAARDAARAAVWAAWAAARAAVWAARDAARAAAWAAGDAASDAAYAAGDAAYAAARDAIHEYALSLLAESWHGVGGGK